MTFIKTLFLFLLLLSPSLVFAAAQQVTGNLQISPSVGQSLLSPPLTVQCTNCTSTPSTAVTTTPASNASGIVTREVPDIAVSVTQVAVIVPTTSTTILAASTARGDCTIRNEGTTDVYLDFTGVAATTATGLTLLPFQKMTCSDISTSIIQGNLTAISGTGSNKLIVIETRR